MALSSAIYVAPVYPAATSPPEFVLATCRCGDETVAVKTDKAFAGWIGTPVGIGFDDAALHLFGGQHGCRIA